MSNDPHIILDKELRRDIDAIIQRLKTAPNFQGRVISEKEALDANIGKLHQFFETPFFAQIPKEEQMLMQRQSDAMVEYSKALSERIAAFIPADSAPNRQSRERSIAITKLQEAVMWLGMDLKAINDATGGAGSPYPNSKDPTNTKIDATADGLRL